MTSAKLPELPKGKEFEEFLAAYLQASGRYVERNIIDRQEEEVLELDIIATDYRRGSAPDLLLIEAKGGRWGFGDIFKLRGWLHYLNMPAAALLVSAPRDPFDFYQKIGESLNVAVVAIPDLQKTAESLAPIGVSAKVKPEDILTWRFSYWAERQLLAQLTSKKKSTTDCKRYNALDSYVSLVNSRVFFTKNVIERAYALYAAFRENPNLSAKVGHEMAGADFDAEHEKIPADVFRRCYYREELNDICISTYVENRARLAVMKSAIDYRLHKEAGSDQNKKLSIQFGDEKFEYSLLDTLPKSFKAGLEKLATHRFFHRYPVFWQWFLWFFGGFIWLEREKEEFTLLAEKSGIPVEEIPNALTAYETLFPREGGWFHRIESINYLLLVPPPFMGIGANYRRLVYSEKQNFDGLKMAGAYAKNNLLRFNNMVVELLNWRSS